MLYINPAGSLQKKLPIIISRRTGSSSAAAFSNVQVNERAAADDPVPNDHV